MRRREPLDPVAARELAAIDAALAGGATGPGAPIGEQDAELARLATLLVAERPSAPPAFRAALDARVAARFPEPERPRRDSGAGAGGRSRDTRDGAGRLRRALRRPLIPSAGATLAVALVALVVVLDQGGGTNVDGGATRIVDGSGASEAPAVGAAPQQDVPQRELAVPPQSDVDGASGAGSGNAADSGGLAAPSQGADGARKVEQSSTVELGAPTDKVDDVAQGVLGVVARQQGIVDQSNISTSTAGGEARFELRIPAGRLQAALAQLSRLPDARVLARTDDTLDVNQAYVSVRRRLAGAEAERGALLRSLGSADDEAETNRLKTRLDAVDRTIASLQRSQRALDRRVDYSRVALTVRTDDGAGSDDDTGFTPGSAFDDAGRVLAVTAGVIVIGAAALVPLALLAACAWPLARAMRRRRREQALNA